MDESPESIIEELRNLGVRVSDILSYHPTYEQLKEMRDGLMTLHCALELFPVPRLSVLYRFGPGGFSRVIRDGMKYGGNLKQLGFETHS